jgi:hypothetical protein
MGKRDELIPEHFLAYLQQAIPGFSGESDKHQMGLARMLWDGSNKRRAHSHYVDHLRFHHTEIDGAFGRRQFPAVNERLGLFTVTPWSVDEKFTKGYAPTDLAKQAIEAYLAKVYRKPTSLLYMDASGIKALKSVPEAVASRDMDNLTTTAWRRAKKLNAAKVDLDTLHRLRSWLVKTRDAWRAGHPPQQQRLFAQIPSLEVIERLADATGRIIRMARTDVLGDGYVMHRYAQSRSGRLYGVGVTLQNAPTLIKQAALVGQWEYDFSNCHFTILDHMAARSGYDCTAIRHYLANKKPIRQEIADQAGISVEQAKVCLLATLYGARASLSDESAIPEAIGKEAAARLYQVEPFRAIKADIQGARQRILAGWPRTRNGRLINAFGKAIPRSAKAEERLAHLIQGVEALALKTVIDMHPDQICLVQHDGWASPDRLNAQAIEAAVLEATGYHLQLEVERIQVDHDAYFLRA